MNRSSVRRYALSGLVFAVFLLHLTGLPLLPFIERMEDLVYDLRLTLTMPNTVDRRIVILDIDEKSLERQGRWPWPRHTLARLVDTLFETHEIKLLAFDVLFAEPDDSSGLPVLERLAEGPLRDDARYRAVLADLRPELARDARFAASIRDRKVVLGYVFQHGERREAGVLPEPLFRADDPVTDKVPFVRATGYTGNLEILQNNAYAAGFFENALVDRDGVFRRVPLLVRHGANLYESLALAVTRVALADPPLELVIPPVVGATARLEWIRLGSLSIPVDERGAALVPYRGPQGSFPYLSATDVLEGSANTTDLRGAIVLVGTTAPGLLDLRTTPFAGAYAGVEVHANLIAGMLDGTIKHKPDYTRGIEFLVLLFSAIVLAVAYAHLTPLQGSLVTLAVVAVQVGINIAAWSWGNLVLPLYAPLLLTFSMFVVHATYGFFVEARGKRQMTAMFGQYVPPELVSEMSEHPEHFGVSGESREMTVLFSDVRNFTTISEGLEPTALTRLMNAYMTPMTAIIHDHRGTIDKYIGDAIMAFWGAPLRDPQHAPNAVDAALAMIRKVDELQAPFRAQGWPEIRIGIGINTGVMNVGNMGSEFRMAYTVMGDAVNLGSRLEGLTKNYGVTILASESTRAQCPGHVFRELDRVRVKGKAEPVRIYEPLGSVGRVDSALVAAAEALANALRYYRTRDWDSAEAQLLRLAQKYPDDKVYALYLERIAHCRAHPPGEGWDGVFTFTSK